MPNLRVAAYQMRVTADLEDNFSKIHSAIEQAAAGGARMLALPECAVSGYPPLHHGSLDQINILRIAELNAEVQDLAKQSGIWVILGTILNSTRGLLNSALVISDAGEIVGRYDKLHLTGSDREFFIPGVGAQSWEMNGLKFGVQICYDARFPEPFRYLRELGCRLIICISNACGKENWKLPVLEGTYRCRAAENSCFLVAVNAAGPVQMATSRICNPLGLDLAAAEVEQEQMLFADIDPAETETGCFFDRRLDQFEVVPRWGGV